MTGWHLLHLPVVAASAHRPTVRPQALAIDVKDLTLRGLVLAGGPGIYVWYLPWTAIAQITDYQIEVAALGDIERHSRRWLRQQSKNWMQPSVAVLSVEDRVLGQVQDWIISPQEGMLQGFLLSQGILSDMLFKPLAIPRTHCQVIDSQCMKILEKGHTDFQ